VRVTEFSLRNPLFAGLIATVVALFGIYAYLTPSCPQLFGRGERRPIAGGPADAAAQLLAANVGVTLSLIAQPEDCTDLTLLDRVRDAALAGVLAQTEAANNVSQSEARASAALVFSNHAQRSCRSESRRARATE
jgi:hypothetical protein